MKIVRVSATPLNVPVTINVLGLNKQTTLSVCLTEIETDTGLTGHGMMRPRSVSCRQTGKGD